MSEILFCLPTECPLCGAPLMYGGYVENEGMTEFEEIAVYCKGKKNCPLSSMILTPMRAEAWARPEDPWYYRDERHIWDSGHLEENAGK